VEPQKRVGVADDEAVVPELVDRLEYQATEIAKLKDEVDALRIEREGLRTELAIANRWVKSLAHEVELADVQLKEMRPLYSRLGKPLRPV
jgi:chromosome segregation ATPase